MCNPLGKKILCFLHGMLRTLRKNLLLSRWGYFRCTWSTRDTLGKKLLLPYWGLFKYAWVHWGRIFCLLYGNDVWYAWSIGEEFSVFLLGIVFLILFDSLGRIFCFLIGESFDDFVPYWANLEMFVSFFFSKKDFFFKLFMTKLHVV